MPDIVTSIREQLRRFDRWTLIAFSPERSRYYR